MFKKYKFVDMNDKIERSLLKIVMVPWIRDYFPPLLPHPFREYSIMPLCDFRLFNICKLYIGTTALGKYSGLFSRCLLHVTRLLSFIIRVMPRKVYRFFLTEKETNPCRYLSRGAKVFFILSFKYFLKANFKQKSLYF